MQGKSIGKVNVFFPFGFMNGIIRLRVSFPDESGIIKLMNSFFV